MSTEITEIAIICFINDCIEKILLGKIKPKKTWWDNGKDNVVKFKNNSYECIIYTETFDLDSRNWSYGQNNKTEKIRFIEVFKNDNRIFCRKVWTTNIRPIVELNDILTDEELFNKRKKQLENCIKAQIKEKNMSQEEKEARKEKYEQERKRKKIEKERKEKEMEKNITDFEKKFSTHK